MIINAIAWGAMLRTGLLDWQKTICTVWGGRNSKIKHVQCGVPQGSFLGSLLCISCQQWQLFILMISQIAWLKSVKSFYIIITTHLTKNRTRRKVWIVHDYLVAITIICGGGLSPPPLPSPPPIGVRTLTLGDLGNYILTPVPTLYDYSSPRYDDLWPKATKNTFADTLPTESVFDVRMLHMLTESGTKWASVWRVDCGQSHRHTDNVNTIVFLSNVRLLKVSLRD